MKTEFQANDRVIWTHQHGEWVAVCDELTATVVYRNLSGQFFHLGLRTADGYEFHLPAEDLFCRELRFLQRALERERIQFFDLKLTAEFLKGLIPPGLAVDDPSINPHPATGCHAQFRKAWQQAREDQNAVV